MYQQDMDEGESPYQQTESKRNMHQQMMDYGAEGMEEEMEEEEDYDYGEEESLQQSNANPYPR